MRTWQKAVGGIGMAAVLAGCGSGFADESAKTILDETEKDMKALSSLRMKGEMSNGGENLAIDMVLSTSGDCKGSMGMSNGEAEILSVDGTSYMKPDAAFWDTFAGAQSQMIQRLVGDKWVVMPSGQDVSQLCDLDEILKDMGGEEKDDEKAEVKGTEEVDGTETVQVSTVTDKGDPLTMWVATDAPHHVLKMEVTEGEEPGVITFSDFDEEVDVEKPADDEVVDLNQAGGGAG